MIAVIETGGKQYLVSPGEKIKIEKVEAKTGDNISFKEVLLIEDEKQGFLLGTPYLEKVEVVGEVIEEGRDDKKVIFKYKPKKRYKVKKGHRQHYTEVKITDIKIK